MYEKNDFVVSNLDTDLKIILLDQQNNYSKINYRENLSMMNVAKSFNILTTKLNVLIILIF